MKRPRLLLLLLLLLNIHLIAIGSPIQDAKSRANGFCKQLQLIEKSVDADYERIASFITDQSSKESLNKVRTQVISNAGFYCDQWKEGKITLEEFTEKETEILQFSFDLENARKLIDAKENKPNTKSPDLSIKPIADKLHIPLKQNVVTGQSGAEDLIMTTVNRIVSKYATTKPKE